MKTSTTLLIAAGAILTVVGVSSAVNADNRDCDSSCAVQSQERYRHMRGPEQGFRSGPPHGGPHGGPMGAMMGNPMFAHGMMGPMVMKRFFETADTDGDGKLTEAEIAAARAQRFESHDTDGNGELTLDEFGALLNELTQPVTVRAFQFLDPDGDGAVTMEEFDRPTSRFVEMFDRNDDGALSKEDRHGPKSGGFRHGRYDESNEDN